MIVIRFEMLNRSGEWAGIYGGAVDCNEATRDAYGPMTVCPAPWGDDWATPDRCPPQFTPDTRFAFADGGQVVAWFTRYPRLFYYGNVRMALVRVPDDAVVLAERQCVYDSTRVLSAEYVYPEMVDA